MRVAAVAREEGAVTGPVDVEAVRSCIAGLFLDAINFIPQQKIVALVISWVVSGTDHTGKRVGPDNRAMRMATSIVLFTPSLMRGTAFDRLARARKPVSPAQAAAMTAMRAARLRLLRVESVARGVVTCTDRASGEALRVLDDTFGPSAVGTTFIAFMAPVDGVYLVATGAVTLDASAQEVAMRHVQPGKPALVQPMRCAETVYGHVIRRGLPPDPAAGPPLTEEVEQPQVGKIDLIAMAWSTSPPGAPRDPRQVQTVRTETSHESVLLTLLHAVRMRQARRMPITEAYEEIALIQLGTVKRRASIGSGRLRLETIEADLEVQVRALGVPPEMLLLFRTLRKRLQPAQPGATNADLEKVIVRIQALRAKTVERGCTEQEALAAAEKVAELLDRYGMTLGETEMREQSCDGAAVETGRKRAGPLDHCVRAMASFFGCRVWMEHGEDGTLRHVYFGLPADVAAARYLYDVVEGAFQTETAQFQAGPLYTGLERAHRRKATESFQIGLSDGISDKLDQIRAGRDKTHAASGMRDLVVVKTEVVERDLAALGINWRSRRSSPGRTVIPGAFDAGQRAGMRFEYRPGVGHDS